MKKITPPKLKLPKRKKKQELSPRITNETVAEHREHILAGGRRFKYPHQYVKHRLVINASIIGVVAVVLVIVLGWWQLYIVQNSSEFMYRVTRVIPVPIASVDGQMANYSDYLMRYRSQLLWLTDKGQLGLSSQDDQRQFDYYKRSVMDGLEADVYAQKRASQLGVSVSDKEVQTVIDNNRNTATGRISQEVYDASTKDTLGYSPDEYRHIIKQALIRQKVSYKVDTSATQTKTALEGQLKQSSPSLEAIAAELNKAGSKVDFGASGYVPLNNLDEGRTQQAAKLTAGQISPVFQATNGNGYYVVQLIGKNSQQLSYQYLHIGLTVFDGEVTKLKKDHKINEFISIPALKTEIQKED